MLKGNSLYIKILSEYKQIELYISNVVEYAYSHKYLIANPILSRNPFGSDLILSVVQENKINYIKLIFIIIKNIITYYSKSFIYYFIFIINYFTYRLSKLRFNNKYCKEEVIVFDVFIMVDKIYPKNAFIDPFFGDLYKYLDKRKINYLMLCLLFGGKPLEFKRRLETYNILARDGRKYLTEYELFTLQDYFEIFIFILVYPIYVIQVLFSSFGHYDRYLKQELINTLDQVTFNEYIRYVFGKRFNRVFPKRIKLLSWYENQTSDKFLIKGIRDSKIASTIYGCQFFPKYELWRNNFPLKVEEIHNLLPDKIFVGGRHYLNLSKNFRCYLGMMPRYNHLFNQILDEKTFNLKDTLLVALTYDINESKRIIKYVKEIEDYFDYKIVVKPHPNHVMCNPYEFPKTWRLFTDNLPEIADKCILVITGGTGAAIEMAALGSSIIVVGKENNLTLNIMPNIGENIIWKIVFTIEELHKAIIDLINIRRKEPKKVIQFANTIRDDCFNQSSEEKLINLFQIHN